MNVKNEAGIPELFRLDDSLYAIVRFQCGHRITVQRFMVGWPSNSRWSEEQLAKISWSGGNGHQTAEEADEVARWLQWASRVAARMNRPDPDAVPTGDMLL